MRVLDAAGKAMALREALALINQTLDESLSEEVIAHLAGSAGANVKITLEIEAEIPSGAPDHVVRTVTENSRTLKFMSHGFESD